MNKKRRDQKGFTMVELVIVVAIMGIIGAVLVPSFNTMSTKAKISTDIATVKTLKRTADIYKAEIGNWPEGDFTTLITELKSKDYLEGTPKLQLKDAKIENDKDKQTIKLDLSGTTDQNIIKGLKQIDGATKTDWVIEPTPSSTSSPSPSPTT